MAFNSRRDSELFNFFYQLGLAAKELPTSTEEIHLIKKFLELAQTENTSNAENMNLRLKNIREKIVLLKDEVNNLPDNTLGSNLSREDYLIEIEQNRDSDYAINFHYVKKVSNQHEIVYTVKSPAEENMLFLVYAPESFIASRINSKKVIKNHLQQGKMGVKVANPFPSKISSGKTEVVSVLLDDVSFNHNYYFQLYVVNSEGYFMSEPLRLVLRNTEYREKDFISSKNDSSINLTRETAAASFIRNIYDRRSQDKDVKSVYNRYGNPSNNSRYDKGG